MIDQHRFREQLETHRLPRPADPPIHSSSFVWYPVAWLPGPGLDQRLAQQRIYQLALDQARAVNRPSLPERDLSGSLN